MSPDSWALVDFGVRREDVDLVSDFLWSMGVQAVEERDGTGNRVILRTSLGEEPSSRMALVLGQFEDTSATIVSLPASISDTWRIHATPTFIDDNIAIVPAWLAAPPGCTAILIEPNDTFGLGNHPTTVLALRMALRFCTEGNAVFDFGCGSGVLAIAVSVIRGAYCDVFDIAESARNTVAENCTLNGATNVRWNDSFDSEKYDVVVANILAPVLRAESSRIAAVTGTDGTLILSGMRDEQVASVCDEFGSFSVVQSESLDGWTCVAMRRG